MIVGSSLLAAGRSDPFWSSVKLLIAPTGNDTGISDRSPLALAVTNAGAVLSTAVGDPWGGDRKAIYFNGTSGYLSVASTAMQMPGNFTIEAWVNLSVVSDGVIFDNRYPDFSAYSGMGLMPASGKASLYGASGVLICADPNLLPTGTWRHIGVTRSGSVVTLFIGGVSVATGTLAPAAQSSQGAYLGKRHAGTSDYGRLSGYLGALRITVGIARSPGQMMVSAPPPTR